MRRLIFLLVFALTASGFSQNNPTKNDIIFMKDGTLFQAKVTKVTDDTINFAYPGETLVNEVKASKIEKVVFASGRTQAFNAKTNNNVEIESPQLQNTPVAENEIYQLSSENSVSAIRYEDNAFSILPIRFTENGVYSEPLSISATEHAMKVINQSATQTGVQVKDIGTTINKLIKSGVSIEQLNNTPMEEAQEILGTEYALRINIIKQTKTAVKKSAWATLDNEKATDAETDYKADIELTLFNAKSKMVSYSATFSEEISVLDKQKQLNTSDAKWKSSLSYALDQLLDSGSMQ